MYKLLQNLFYKNTSIAVLTESMFQLILDVNPFAYTRIIESELWRFISTLYHHNISYHHITSSYHIIISHRITSSHHIIIRHHHISYYHIISYHHLISYHHMIISYHTIISHHGYHIMLRKHQTNQLVHAYATACLNQG